VPTDETYEEVLRRLDEQDIRIYRLEQEKGGRMNEQGVEEVTGEIAGQKFTLKSLSLNTLLTLIGVVGVVAVSVLMWTHLGESKESSAAMVGALRELTAAQKDQTMVAREQNCLISLPQDRRDPELCRRIAR
jgi:hypothetical protein